MFFQEFERLIQQVLLCQKTRHIRGIVLGTVHSSDRASKEDRGILEDLFVDEIREFNEEHNLDGWE